MTDQPYRFEWQQKNLIVIYNGQDEKIGVVKRLDDMTLHIEILEDYRGDLDNIAEAIRQFLQPKITLTGVRFRRDLSHRDACGIGTCTAFLRQTAQMQHQKAKTQHLTHRETALN